MGLLSWWKGNPSPPPPTPTPTPTPTKANSSPTSAQDPHQEVPGLNGAVEVRRRPEEVTVFEFGSIAASGERATLAGYCPVSDDLEPCRWEIVPAAGPDAPQFRIVFQLHRFHWRVTLYDDEKLPILLPNLKELQLLVGTISREDLPCIYNFFRLCPSPFLEKLFIRLWPGDVEKTCYNKQEVEDPSDVNFSHLKVIKVSNFRGRESEMRLVGFLLKKAVILESMVLVGPPKSAMQSMDIEPSSSVAGTATTRINDLESLRLQLALLPKVSSRAGVILCEHSEDDLSLTPTHTEYFGEYQQATKAA